MCREGCTGPGGSEDHSFHLRSLVHVVKLGDGVSVAHSKRKTSHMQVASPGASYEDTELPVSQDVPSKISQPR